MELNLQRPEHRDLVTKISNILITAAKSNITKGSFFGVPYKPSMFKQTLVKSGALRDSIKLLSVDKDTITVGSELPYAAIHQTGGLIPVTTQMKKYFWAMFYETGDERYKFMALTQKKVLEIPPRPYLGANDAIARRIGNLILDEFGDAILNQLPDNA